MGVLKNWLVGDLGSIREDALSVEEVAETEVLSFSRIIGVLEIPSDGDLMEKNIVLRKK